MREITIDAIKVEEGQTVTRILTTEYTGLWRKRPVAGVDQRIRKSNGQWPTVINAGYWENGEGGKPTVALELSNGRGAAYHLSPDDQVTVLVED